MQDPSSVEEAVAAALEGLVEIAPPESVSWWPRTPGWFVLGAFLAGLLTVWIVRRWRSWQGNAYRRAALTELAVMEREARLEGPAALVGLSELLHRTVLAVAPRRKAAGLPTREWYQTLDAAAGRPLFCERDGDVLVRLTYGRAGLGGAGRSVQGSRDRAGLDRTARSRSTADGSFRLMLEVAYPWVFLLLPAPLLAFWLLPTYREPRRGLRLPFFAQLAHAAGETPAPGALVMRRGWVQSTIAVVVWGLTIAALARPQWVEDPIERIDPARDLLLAVDLSGSMDTRDFVDPDGTRMDRLSAVKRVLGDFITRRSADRLGLIVFGQAPYMQAPFTLDHDLVRQLLDESRVGMAGPQTMLGDAIGLAIKHFDHAETDEKVLVLLTDGNDTGSRVPPTRAAEIAAERDIVIYTIGVGDPEAAGEAPLNADLLRGIARGTGGEFFRADDRSQLEAVAAAIDVLEPSELETLSYRPKLPLYFWPLGAAIGLALLYSGAMALITRHA